MEKKNDFKPFISADKVLPEFTVTSVILGMILAVIFGGANAYLGLRVGMTVSASIPAAVISMGVIRVILKKDSILENNMVQTIGSAGESLAAGAIFTIPAIFIWASEKGSGVTAPSFVSIALIALCGGILGVLFMVPLRTALIVEEHGVLPYPEGTACAEVLLAGEEGGSKSKVVFAGLSYGELTRMKIDNMREEHNERVIMSNEKAVAKTAEEELKKMESAQDKPRKPEGFICVSAGTGLSEIFTELGVDVIIEGGQTMNPSTEDILEAIEQINADTIYILPNNSNIILAAAAITALQSK